jgi:hypothetical protein
MSLLAIADSFYIGVLDLTAAPAWYIEKLGLQKVPVEIDDAEGCVVLGFSVQRFSFVPRTRQSLRQNWWSLSPFLR